MCMSSVSVLVCMSVFVSMYVFAEWIHLFVPLYSARNCIPTCTVSFHMLPSCIHTYICAYIYAYIYVYVDQAPTLKSLTKDMYIFISCTYYMRVDTCA